MKEVGFPRDDKMSLRELAVRTVLRNVRAHGHPYIDLREDNKFIYFCTLCLAPCYNDFVLFDHLRGNLHNDRLASAKLTLLLPNPWPFNDGILFFDNSGEDNKVLEGKDDSPKLLEFHGSENLAIVEYGKETQQLSQGHDAPEAASGDAGEDCNFLIPNALLKAGISNLLVRFVGAGKIAARYVEKDDGSSSICRIWCEWLGKQSLDDDDGDDDEVEIPKHDFAIIVLAYNYDLGRKGLFDDVTSLLTSSSTADPENGDNASKKRKKCFSDPEDVSHSHSRQYDSSGEESAVSSASSSRLLVDKFDDQILNSRIISSKTIRRELRRQQRIAAERMCDICQQKMLPGKDVSTLLNLKTGRLACSSRNFNGAFHVYHTSCLIHWILLCDSEIARSPSAPPQSKGRSRKKNGVKRNKVKKDDEQEAAVARFDSVFCPECQGTGISTSGDGLERDKVSLSKMFNFKLKVSYARKAWIKSPETLENCSVGFHFPQKSEENAPGKGSPLKLLNFYTAINEGCPNGSLELCK